MRIGRERRGRVRVKFAQCTWIKHTVETSEWARKRRGIGDYSRERNDIRTEGGREGGRYM